MADFEMLPRAPSMKLKLSAIPSRHAYLQDNEFIHGGYRVGLSVADCIKRCEVRSVSTAAARFHVGSLVAAYFFFIMRR